MLGDIRLKTLRLLDENMQSSGRQDYLDKMDSFIDMAQKHLAEVLPIRRTKVLAATGRTLQKTADMREVTAIRSVDYETIYPMIPVGDALLVPEAGEYLVEYCAYPETIADKAPEDYELEIRPEAQDAIAFFAAAMCVPDENPQLYAFFLSQYNERIANLEEKKPPTIKIKAGTRYGI